MNRIFVVLACLFGVAAGDAQAQLDPVERRIAAAVQSRGGAPVELLEKAVRIDSGTLNMEGVRQVGALFSREYADLGFHTRWLEMPAEMKRAGHLVASSPTVRGKAILLLGHLDTVFERGTAAPVWERRGDRIYGQGVYDMKGGLVVMLEAVRALKGEGLLQNRTIHVLLTGDEERVGTPIEMARAPLVELARRSAFALSFEGISRDPSTGALQVVAARRSTGRWTLKVNATAGHSMNVFSASYGAAYDGVRILDEFRRQVIEPNVTFNIGLLAAGTDVSVDYEAGTASVSGKGNVIAKTMQAQGDLRTLSREQTERVREKMRRIVGSNLPGAKADISFAESYPPMEPTPRNMELAALYDRVSEDAGLGKVTVAAPASRGAGDVQFAAPYISSLDGLGVGGGGAHTDAEYMNAQAIEEAATRAALLIYRLMKEHP